MWMPISHAFQTQIEVLKRNNRVLKANNVVRVEEADKTISVLSNSIKLLTTSLQAAYDPITNIESSTSNRHYTGNPYKTYATQVKVLHSKYDLKDDWGCMTLKNIVDVRAAFMIGRGVQVIKRDGFKGDASRELSFIRDFINFNNIDEEAPQDWAVGTELEGKVLLRLVPVTFADYRDKPRKMIRVVYVPWDTISYTVIADEPNYYRYVKAYYKGSTTRPDSEPVDTSFDLSENQFIYKRFGGSTYRYNETPPKAAFVLRQIEDLDKELWDWRKINSLFAAPTPVITVDDVSEALRIQEQIDGKNWRIGKALVLANGKFDLVMYKGEGFTTLQKAIEADIQAISGATGVPVHFLGHPELLSNRATAENLLELIELSTGKERKVWIGTYEELFQKAILMYNEFTKGNLNPMAIDADIPFTSSQSLKVIKDVYLPMYQENAMSLQQLLSYISEVDVEQEIERIEENKKDDLSSEGQSASDGGFGNSRDGGSQVAGED